MKRLGTLVAYLFQDLFRSLTGLLVGVAALVLYLVAIVSVTGGIDRDYYALVIGGFFAAFALVLTILISDRAYHATSDLLILRFPSRMPCLAGVALTVTMTWEAVWPWIWLVWVALPGFGLLVEWERRVILQLVAALVNEVAGGLGLHPMLQPSAYAPPARRVDDLRRRDERDELEELL